jgi:hypothetical protein
MEGSFRCLIQGIILELKKKYTKTARIFGLWGEI